MYKSHISGDRIQSCNEHGQNTARYAKENLESLGLISTAYLCGLLHDVGKCTDDFNAYIEAAAKGEDVVKGSVIHTFAGVRMILSNFHSRYNSDIDTDAMKNLTAELIAIAIGSHHGLFDIFNQSMESGFDHRMKKQPTYDEKAAENFYLECSSYAEINELFHKAKAEIATVYANILELIQNSRDENKEEELLFYLGMLERLLISALIDADRQDTMEFMSGNAIRRAGTEGNLSTTKQGINEIWEFASKNLMQGLNTLPSETEIQQARRDFSEYCEKFAERKSGIYRLSLPTGSGKTLSSLRYALAHAKKFGKKHIIFVIPLLSILDQNADVIKKAVGNEDIILEHHSNVIVENPTPENCARQELLMETWDSPIVITTLVQFLNTLFDGRTSSIRRFHNLADSVVIIDEVQSVPTKMLSLFNLALNFLSRLCGTTFLLCSATQPLFEFDSHGLLVDDAEIVPQKNMKKYCQLFKRTSVEYVGNLSEDEIIHRLEAYYSNYGSTLLICNTKKEAFELFKKAKNIAPNCIHLSTSMCAAHRKTVLGNMALLLEKKEPLICVSTQLIEAGVDVSFNSIIRLAAGIDNVAQAAGRGNRNGEMNCLAPVALAFFKDEKLKNLKEIKSAQDVTGELITEFNKHPSDFDNDLISDKSVKYYYKTLSRKNNQIMGSTEYCVNNYKLLDLLSCNAYFATEEKLSTCSSEDAEIKTVTMRQAFKEAGSKFTVFEDEQSSVIVPYEDGKYLINDILSERFSKDVAWSKEILKDAQEFTVNLFDYQVAKLSKNDAIYTDNSKSVMILKPEYYDEKLGIIFEEGDVSEWDTLIL